MNFTFVLAKRGGGGGKNQLPPLPDLLSLLLARSLYAYFEISVSSTALFSTHDFFPLPFNELVELVRFPSFIYLYSSPFY